MTTFAALAENERVKKMMEDHYTGLVKAVTNYEVLLASSGIDYAEIRKTYDNQINDGTYGSIAEQFNAGKPENAVNIAERILLDGVRDPEERKRIMMMNHYLGLLKEVKKYEELLNAAGIKLNQINGYGNQINGTYGSIAEQFGDGGPENAVDLAKRTFK